jgi:zinc transporter 11
MIAGYNAVIQTFLGTLFTWGLTAAGAALVFVFDGKQVVRSFVYFVNVSTYVKSCIVFYHIFISLQRKVLDGSLGFAAGVGNSLNLCDHLF